MRFNIGDRIRVKDNHVVTGYVHGKSQGWYQIIWGAGYNVKSSFGGADWPWHSAHQKFELNPKWYRDKRLKQLGI